MFYRVTNDEIIYLSIDGQNDGFNSGNELIKFID